MKILEVKTGKPYKILIEGGLLTEVPEDLKKLNLGYRYALISDSQVAELLGEDLLCLLKEAGLSAELFIFPAGEASKNMDTVVSLAREMIRAGFDRKCAVIALGGGVTGDLAGFLASIYLRGVPYVQIPTSLLAQVDSSVGGKTGVDLPEGKNLLGTFYQPWRVYIDYGVLSTLPFEHLKNGLAEVAKYGCISSPELFEFLEQNSQKLLNYDAESLEHIIYESCRIKAEVVSRDEKEGGLRRILNFGHTLGHAIEAAANYQILHGLCVSIGMVAAALLSEKLGVAEEKISPRLVKLLEALGLPTRIPQELETEEILSFLRADKKVWKGKLIFVLLKKLGIPVFYEEPPKELLKEIVEELKAK
ncbi:3-dehydroquinate synthase [Thermodesulfatator autotrophicus]|uniref:3-dehydroquinate synthase n=1 Tax=Thermodesulfatator autotrophicus TaxID=1795632 RepID=A0A177EAD8_9BACT|nr:3-dehydroquinate synthase [Thermodesulfatator autotrophicus]OAG28390.1 3-dehydroquinate synthase [Thermodesulfatator autotrophicus]